MFSSFSTSAPWASRSANCLVGGCTWESRARKQSLAASQANSSASSQGLLYVRSTVAVTVAGVSVRFEDWASSGRATSM